MLISTLNQSRKIDILLPVSVEDLTLQHLKERALTRERIIMYDLFMKARRRFITTTHMQVLINNAEIEIARKKERKQVLSKFHNFLNLARMFRTEGRHTQISTGHGYFFTTFNKINILQQKNSEPDTISSVRSQLGKVARSYIKHFHSD